MIKTRYPIVLVHGMMAKDFMFYHAFRGISDYLKALGFTVFVTNQDGVGSIITNAAQLKEEILEIIKQENCEKVNIIAHSKGGLDCRYMISNLDMEAYVASLTTLSTPHHGSGLSKNLLKMPRFVAKPIAFITDLFFRICGDRDPDFFRLGQELTPEAMEQFNRNTPDAPCVYYQSYSSSLMEKKSWLYIPYKVSRHFEQDITDGMVSVSSSQWGEYRGDIGDNLDHFKIVGAYGSKKKLARIGLYYLHIIARLQTLGF